MDALLSTCSNPNSLQLLSLTSQKPQSLIFTRKLLSFCCSSSLRLGILTINSNLRLPPYLPMQSLLLYRASMPSHLLLRPFQSMRPFFSRPSLAADHCTRFQLASPTPRSPMLVSSMHMLVTNPPPMFPCLLTAMKRTRESIAHISCGFSPSPISEFGSFSQPLNPLRALPSSYPGSSDGFVMRTEEQMKRAELLSKYDIATLKVSEFETQHFIHSMAYLVLFGICLFLTALKLEGILTKVVDKSSWTNMGKDLLKIVLENFPSLLLFIQNSLLGITTQVLIDQNSSLSKRQEAVQNQRLAKLRLCKHDGDQAMKVAATVASLQAVKVAVTAVLFMSRRTNNESNL